VRTGEDQVKSAAVPLKTGRRAADEKRGMTESNAAIVEQYAAHLSSRASSALVSFALVGVAGGAALGAVPGHLSHSLIAGGANYFAVLLGAVAGGIAGRSLGEKRAAGLRFEAQLALRQLQVEARLFQLVGQAAVVTAPASVPPVTASASPVSVLATPPPEPMFVPAPAPPVLQPTAPPLVAPAPVSLAPPPLPPPAPAPAAAPVPVSAPSVAARPLEQAPALPPLSS
jgi:outer membrane lipoprotein SlyB